MPPAGRAQPKVVEPLVAGGKDHDTGLFERWPLLQQTIKSTVLNKKTVVKPRIKVTLQILTSLTYGKSLGMYLPELIHFFVWV